ncbi:MAG: hypothetical protein K8R49_07065 [Candidatus Cloacimonetes bacterium]|nr:hypothetical protein [Candidatus Cloacimonadota bacterium]
MKRIIIIIFLLVLSSLGIAQNNTKENTASGKFKNIKKLKSKADEEVKVEIRKPDNASLMIRTETDHGSTVKLNTINKFKKSNKLLY